MVQSLASTRHLTNIEMILSDYDTYLPDASLDAVLFYDTYHPLNKPEVVMREFSPRPEN